MLANDFKNQTNLMLAKCLHYTGDDTAAHQTLLQLSKTKGGLTPDLSELAGRVQTATISKPLLEDQIKKAEPVNENTIEYWRSQAFYYRGAEDAAKGKDALDHAA